VGTGALRRAPKFLLLAIYWADAMKRDLANDARGTNREDRNTGGLVGKTEGKRQL
jgi:hypothetical protein